MPAKKSSARSRALASRPARSAAKSQSKSAPPPSRAKPSMNGQPTSPLKHAKPRTTLSPSELKPGAIHVKPPEGPSRADFLDVARYIVRNAWRLNTERPDKDDTVSHFAARLPR